MLSCISYLSISSLLLSAFCLWQVGCFSAPLYVLKSLYLLTSEESQVILSGGAKIERSNCPANSKLQANKSSESVCGFQLCTEAFMVNNWDSRQIAEDRQIALIKHVFNSTYVMLLYILFTCYYFWIKSFQIHTIETFAGHWWKPACLYIGYKDINLMSIAVQEWGAY